MGLSSELLMTSTSKYLKRATAGILLVDLTNVNLLQSALNEISVSISLLSSRVFMSTSFLASPSALNEYPLAAYFCAQDSVGLSNTL